MFDMEIGLPDPNVVLRMTLNLARDEGFLHIRFEDYGRVEVTRLSSDSWCVVVPYTSLARVFVLGTGEEHGLYHLPFAFLVERQ